MKLSQNAKNAIMIGTLCTISYLAIYVARNVLSAVSTQLGAQGVVNDVFYGTLSAAYFWFYAVGQLINGAIGQKINARWMMSLGLLFSGVLNLVFPLVVVNEFSAIIVYGMSGFFLAMIYGPMTKVVAENTLPIHAVRCSLGYTFASFFGSPLAGVLATFLVWQSVFTVSSLMLLIMAVVVFAFFIVFEKKGIVKYNLYKPKKSEGGAVKVLLKHHFIKFCLISIITGIVRTCWVSWLPKYFVGALGYEVAQSSGIFSIATFVIAFTTFVAIFVYERLKRNINLTLIIMFIVAIASFIGTLLIKQPIINIVLMVIAIMASNGAATMLWSVYCPSLRDTGFVSGATGFLDFLSYLAAGTSTLVIGAILGAIGWNGILIILVFLMVFGLIVSLPLIKGRKQETEVIDN